jgi:hypothetical protein
MRSRFFSILFFFCLHLSLQAKSYVLENDPIDVVFVSHPKDQETLNYAIDGIRENAAVRRIIVVSSIQLSDKAEWYDEKDFPFSKDDIRSAITRGDKAKAKTFFQDTHYGPAWYYQQLLKLYSPYVIPGISSNVLIIDADTIFMNPVEFLNDSFGGLFCVNHGSKKPGYFAHAKRLVPNYKRIYPKYYSVCHHMLFQKPILDDLFSTVEKYHHKPFWVAFCEAVSLKKNLGASEYEIYYSFALNQTKQVGIRELKWENSPALEKRDTFKAEGYQFVSFHTYLRKNKKLPSLKH